MEAKVYAYPAGGEVVIYPEPLRESRGAAAPESVEVEDHRLRAARRARQQVIRIARTNAFTNLFTLTFGSTGEQDYTRAKREVARFLNRAGRELFVGRYLLVLELHPQGHGWHAHLLTDRFIPVDPLRDRWTSFLLAPGKPYDSVTGRVRIDAQFLGDAEVGGVYAAKYVGKEFDGYGLPAGTRRFSTGQQVAQPAASVVRSFVESREQLVALLGSLGVPPAGVRAWSSVGATEHPVEVYSWR